MALHFHWLHIICGDFFLINGGTFIKNLSHFESFIWFFRCNKLENQDITVVYLLQNFEEEKKLFQISSFQFTDDSMYWEDFKLVLISWWVGGIFISTCSYISSQCLFLVVIVWIVLYITAVLKVYTYHILMTN